ncbi:DNA-3-methyladenine glycosylase 2 family protein [Pseudoalteromonas sp. McH1-7]|uniref:DNA-3-methyladenine glycosylase 2 family protein n=1 Tax=Pseudoalteromonas TaxID=53246 RepID=UPI00159078FE|nr:MULTISPECIES: AlkA N-terminal domain-containing protein [Pseudoalteromonas]MDW7549183.1 AlkA N-terminal domain-containing protein [Pseudoalteromonas peptidolytica]NUZ09983.1 DNA-3-methyladenine glycosylase 2 family protein [Pseudoalteromonas sp. McH1-7]USD30947.1 DNA-3-methyladenine glycosylase 2 family protein [Pseudoalteromonas sp. SCSIO 43201]
MYTPEVCSEARNSRDARFDGLFFVAVKSTGIYCRPICPAPAAKESNVEYFQFAHNAAQAGFRPCIRCRPDSAPGSYAWLGTETTAVRAKKLIDEGALLRSSTSCLAERLGISVRYLNKIFSHYFGTSPKQYALYKQCDLAKQLLQQTDLPVTQVAFAAGFKSLRRFNDAFQKLYQLSPSRFRKGTNRDALISIYLSYRPPYNWQSMQQFLAKRIVPNLEWLNEQSYGRTVTVQGITGRFCATIEPHKHRFKVDVTLSDLSLLVPMIAQIRRVLDLDADTHFIESHLRKAAPDLRLQEGLRLPGIWDEFEAGIRAILGQQISVQAAKNLLTLLVSELGEKTEDGMQYFPSAQAVFDSELVFFNMPASRKAAIRAFAQQYVEQPQVDIDSWQNIKGIGPWTVNYAKMRGLSHPDIYLGGDLGVKKALEKSQQAINVDKCAPFRSYLTFQLWQLL